ELDVCITRMTRDQTAVGGHWPRQRAQFRQKKISQSSYLLALLIRFSASEQFGGGTKPDAQRCRQSSRAQIMLLSATINDGLNASLDIPANVQSTYALWPIHFVCRQACQVRCIHQRSDIHRAGSLRSITVQQNTVSLGQGVDFGKALYYPYFTVHH